MLRTFVLLFALFAAINCVKFTSSDATVQINSGDPRAAEVIVDTDNQKQQINYVFGVVEHELFGSDSRYQTCPATGDCKNFFINYPMIDFARRTGQQGTENVNGINSKKYVFSQGDYQTKLWVDSSNSQRVVRAEQTGDGVDRVFNFFSFTLNSASFTAPSSDCQSVQCANALDMMIVIDASGSITPGDYQIEKDYAKNVVDSFIVSTEGVNIGFVTFSTLVYTHTPLNGDATIIKNSIDNAVQLNGQTNIGGAIQAAHSELAQGRDGVAQIILLITDGAVNEPTGTGQNPTTYMIARADDAKADGILIYSVGVGSAISELELEAIASSPIEEYTSFVSEFIDLQETIATILTQVCTGGIVETCSGCEDDYFCACDACVCGLDDSHCGGRGTFDSASCTCTACNDPFSSDGVSDCSACAFTCSNGASQDDNDCSCNCVNGYSGPTCFECDNTPASGCENEEVHLGGCNGCACQSPWKLDLFGDCTECDYECNGNGVPNSNCDGCICVEGAFWNQNKDCRTCGINCNNHGSPNTDCTACICDEEDFYVGQFCDDCDRPCENESNAINGCSACDCTGTNFSGPFCGDCTRCGDNGDPVDSLCDACICKTDWAGDTCQECVFDCHGRGTPKLSCDSCTCRGQFTTISNCEDCNDAYCKNGVFATQDDCAISKCTCNAGWKGNTCNTCRTDVCKNGGYLEKSTDCQICKCINDWEGDTCTFCDRDVCVHGTKTTNCNGCECDDLWQGAECHICDTATFSAKCSGHGSIIRDDPEVCAVCDCAGSWIGETCQTCDFNCHNNGTPIEDGNCNKCSCNGGFIASEQCETCDTSPDSDYCSGHGQIDNTDGFCNKCVCSEDWSGDNCEICSFDCTANGSPIMNEACNSCTCEDGFLAEENCTECDPNLFADFCNNRGSLPNLDGNCDLCDCTVNNWEGPDCNSCNFVCAHGGTPDLECDVCECPGFYTVETSCEECGLDCNGNGYPNGDCTACVCVGGFTTSSNCFDCDQSYKAGCQNGSQDVDLQECQCDCQTLWSGEFCDVCDVDDLEACNAPEQGGYLTSFDGTPLCQCICSGNWMGSDCGTCAITEETASVLCIGFSEPDYDTCTCQCPDYYAPTEACQICLITNEDCVHIVEGSEPDTTAGICACECEEPWTGRTCEECPIDCSDPDLYPPGLYLDEETCTCVNICGDGIIVPEFEECENNEETDAEDTVCCKECEILTIPCDDGIVCTFDDRCVNRECDGVTNIDFSITQDRTSLPTGDFSNEYWTRWGVQVSTSGPVNLVVYDSLDDASDSRYVFPSANTERGGDNEFGNILVASTLSPTSPSAVCFAFSEPKEIEATVVLSVNTLTATVDYHCADGNLKTINLIGWGLGSAQLAPNPCGGPVTNICYNNLANAAIEAIYTCEAPDYIIGSLGDYVWHDLSVDNIQDDIELGIPLVEVNLKLDDVVIATTTTDSEGLYLFPSLFAGTYEVEFFAPDGFRFSTPTVELFSSFILHEGSIKNIQLDAGETDLTIDVGLYLFGAIGDYVFLDENRDGTQDENIGVGEVTMNLYRSDDMDNIIETTQTTSTGSYLFAPLPVYATPTTFASYVVEMVPPPYSIVTEQYAGDNTVVDSNFDIVSLLSEVITLTEDKKIDLTIDGGIYYCCGTVGDFVFFDDNKNGIQDDGEDGVEGVKVILFWNDEAIATQITDEEGLYLFEELELSGDYFVHFERPTDYVWTISNQGDDTFDSDPDSDGFSHTFTLTPEVPDVLTIDAGIVEGCVTDDECGTDDLCQSASCQFNQCVFVVSIDCSDADIDQCFDAFCDSKIGKCIPVPTDDTNRVCNDENACTSNDLCSSTGTCVGTPNSNPCNDNNECTILDECRPNGECAGVPDTCDIENTNNDPCVEYVCVEGEGCVPTFTTASCNDEDACTFDDVCSLGECVGTPLDCTIDTQCQEGFCLDGECAIRNISENCSDGSSCTDNDFCDEGVCVGIPLVCDSDDCHSSVCVFGACVEEFLPVDCDDGDLCTINDKCNPITEQCEGELLDCEDNNPCTLTTCVAGDCHITHNPEGVCDDNDSCTISTCVDLTCVHQDVVCEDNEFCTSDVCVDGKCVFTDNTFACDDNDFCTMVDQCVDGECTGVPRNCEDGDICTDNFCEDNACQTVFNNAPCDDGDACSTRDLCFEGVCTGFDVLTCEEESSQCAEAVCNPEKGRCEVTFVVDETPCSNNNLCTVDVCIQGECIGEPNNCDDNNPCTDDFCINGVCVHDPTTELDVECTDGNSCTEGDECVASVCVGSPINCDDGNKCSTDICVDGECVHEDNTLSCDDNDSCTFDDICVEKECVGEPLVCKSNNVCFDSECVAGTCVQTPNEAECNDGNPCTEDDVCFEGVCGSSSDIDCRADNQCQTSVCDIASGDCISTNIEGDCDDGNACTEDDVCLGGQCVGTPKVCSSDNVCEDASCDAETGECVFTPNSAQCDDENPCTLSDSCIASECVGANTIFCSTDNRCTDAECSPITGQCEEYNIENTCSDFDSCTGDDRCVEGECVGDLLEECIPECVLPIDCDASNLCEAASCVLGVCRYEDLNLCENDDACVRRTCDPSTGECLINFTDSECDDGNECTEVDFCIGGECVGTQTVVCEEIQCFVGSCDSESGACVFTVTEGNSCNDENDCTVNDICTEKGECVGSQINCDDGNVCTDDFCVNGICLTTDNTRTCSDGDLCTVDMCISGECVGEPIVCESSECMDAECVEGQCVETPTDASCDDGNACTVNDVCIEGECVGEERVCESEDPCVDVECVNGECQSTFNTATCDDFNGCTVNDRCIQGECIGQAKDCSELDTDCSSGSCVDGECTASFEEFENFSCVDDNICTSSSVCVAGECVGTEDVVCENANPCSIGTCVSDTGCVFENNNISCSIANNACVEAVCLNQSCQIVSETVCDDGNVCTNDVCDPSSGECVHSDDSSLSCSDNDPCTNDFCENGNCVSEPVICNDNNACTTDVCRNGECVFAPNFSSCEHESACVLDARCDALGGCTTVVAVNSCESENPCAVGSCDLESGECVLSAVDGIVSCDDENACTSDDICQPDMTCSGSEFECSLSANPCQVNVCDREVGCVSIPNPIGSCSTDSICSSERCVEGQCRSTPVQCSDNDACTYDHICTEEDGCVSSAYSCLLSPCVFSVCSDNVECVIQGNRDNWTPLIYFALTNPNTGRHYLAATSSEIVYRDAIEVVDPILSLDVKPYTGELYAIGGESGKSVLRVPKKADTNRLNSDVVFVSDIEDANVDISFKPTLVSIESGYEHSLWGMTRASSDASFFVFDTLSNQVTPISETPTFYAVQSWDNHGHNLYGVVGKQLHAWNPVTKQDNVLCSGVDVIPTGQIISIDTRIDEVLVGAVQDGADLHIFTIDFRVQSGTAICDVTSFSIDGIADDDDSTTQRKVITALAFDDTICFTVTASGVGSDGGQNQNQNTGGDQNRNQNQDTNTGNTSGNLGPTGPAPANNANSASANARSDFPGQDTNYVLTGNTAQASAAVIGVIGAGGVAVFAFFAVAFGLNNTKEDTVVPISGLLETTEVSHLTAENPIFQGAVGASTNVIAG